MTTETRVRNGSKAIYRAGVTVFATALSLPAMAAQPRPTAENVQRFLAEQIMKVATQVRYVDDAGRINHVTGKYTGQVKTVKGGLRKTKETIEALPERLIDKQLGDLRALELQAIDAYGRPSLCATRITRVEAPDYNEHRSDTADDKRAFSFTFKYTDEWFTYEPLAKFMSPAQVIDWSRVKVGRSPEGYVTVTATGQQYPTIHLTYHALDAETADRIEYAMKFLALSCSPAGATGT